jgi:ABC-type enterochelin transport system substrate-binding protein
MEEPRINLTEAAEIFNKDQDVGKLLATIDSLIEAAEAEQEANKDAGSSN